jgi:hypothetical protein
MVRHIHQSYPQVINMCQVLEPVAESLMYHHRHLDDDDLEDVTQDLVRYLNKDWKRECGQHVWMANVDKGMKDPGGILI